MLNYNEIYLDTTNSQFFIDEDYLDFPFYGEKEKKFAFPDSKLVVLVSAEEHNDDGLVTFLKKVLTTFSFEADEVVIQGISDKEEASFKHKAVLVLSFGVDLKQVSIFAQVLKYSPLKLKGATYLLADNLSTIQTNQTAKKQLWSFIQQFNSAK